MPKEIRVLLVDDHVMLRKGMRLLLDDEADITVVGEAGDGEDAIAQAKALKPDIVVMDITMPRVNGIQATRKIAEECSDSKVIALSIHSSKRFVDDMLNAGAAGYLLKESVPEELIDGIRAVMRGEMLLSSAITRTVVSAYVEHLPDKPSGDEQELEAGVLRSKLHAPPVTPELVPRQRLFDHLNAGRMRPLTLVSAPAGYGKSVLISSWLMSSDWPGVWLSLDEHDGDLRQFLSYVAAAVRRAFPDACKQMLGLTKTSQLPSLPVLAACVSNDMDEIGEPFLLVLDDYQNIEIGSQVNDLIQQLLVRPPIPLHLVIITRRDPPLPLVPLRAGSQVTDVRAQDLRFQTAEAAAMLEYGASFAATDEALANVQQEMEGWAVGLRLVALALHHTQDPNKFLKNLRGGVKQTREYLVQEVIAMQSAKLRDWLLKSAILDEFCAPLCEAVCVVEGSTVAGEFDGGRFIESLQKENLFTISNDARGVWFRYHHLFRQLLQYELRRNVPAAEIAELHSRASAWFESEGLMEQSFHHAQAAGDTERAGQIVARNWRAVVSRDQWYVLDDWLSQLPDSVVQQQPQLLLASSWRHYHQMDLSKLPLILARVDELMEATGEIHDHAGELHMFRGFCAFFENDGARALDYFERALEQIPVTDHAVRGDAEVLFGLAGQMVGERERVTSVLTEWLNDSSTLGPLRETRLLMALTHINYLAGDLLEAKNYIPRQRNVARSEGLMNAIAWCDYLEGLIHLQRGELNPAIAFLEEATDRKHFHYTRAAMCALVALSISYQASGQSEQAIATLQSLRELVAQLDPWFQVVADSCEARLALMQGRPEIAAQWLQTSASSPADVMLFWFEIPLITRCRALVAEGSADSLREAEDRLHEYAEMNEGHHNVLQLVGIMAMLAVACEKQGKATQALSHLQQALALGRSGGIVFPFLELGPPMAGLLQRLPKQDVNAAFVGQILSVFDTVEKTRETADIPGQTGSPVNEPLTNRERDILELLAKRLQNKEIAARLFVSPETVKYHLKHLFQKLDVSNRRDAAARATDILATGTDAPSAQPRKRDISDEQEGLRD